MTESDVDPRLVRIALADTEGFEFERFGQELFAALVGVEFVPMGGRP